MWDAKPIVLWRTGGVLALGLVFVVAMAIGAADPPSVVGTPVAQSDGGKAATTQPQGHEVGNASVRAAIDAWEKLLRESKFATVTCRVRRTTTKLDLSKEGSEPVVTRDIVLRAEAVMKRDANWLLVWDDANRDQPVLKLQCVDHKVREDLWDPANKQYRVSKYLAPTAFGANDTKYEDGCMIGNFLSTWLGVGHCEGIDLRRMREGQALDGLVEIRGKQCRVIRYTFPDNDEKNSIIREYFLDREGRLVRWRGVQTTIEGTNRVEIAQTEERDLQFFAEVPAEAQAHPPAQTAPAPPASPAHP